MISGNYELRLWCDCEKCMGVKLRGTFIGENRQSAVRQAKRRGWKFYGKKDRVYAPQRLHAQIVAQS